MKITFEGTNSEIFDMWPFNTSKIIKKLDTIISMLSDIKQKEVIIMADLTGLTEQVAANTEVEQSAVVLLQGLADLLKAAGTDPVALQTLQDQLKTSADALAAAIVANTPAA